MFCLFKVQCSEIQLVVTLGTRKLEVASLHSASCKLQELGMRLLILFTYLNGLTCSQLPKKSQPVCLFHSPFHAVMRLIMLQNSPIVDRKLAATKQSIHNPKNVKVSITSIICIYLSNQIPQHLLSLLQQKDAWKLLGPNEEEEYPLHSIVQSCHRNKVELLETLLTHSSINVNSHGKSGMTALHYAVQVNNIPWLQCRIQL